MANPTTNFGWVMPSATDLVTDLPADFDVFGQAVDTDFVGLKGGTTGQVLSKTSATDMAFTWIANDVGDITGVTAGTGISGGGTSGDVTVTNSMATAITTAGDLIKGTGSGTFDALGIGSTGQVLTVAAGTASWATPTGASKSYALLNGSGTALSGSASTTISGLSGYDDLFILIRGASVGAVGTVNINFRINASSTAADYAQMGGFASYEATYGSGVVQAMTYWQNNGAVLLPATSSNAASVISGAIKISGCNTAGIKVGTASSGGDAAGGNTQRFSSSGFVYNGTSVISSIFVGNNAASNFDAGTLYVYGAV